jgi:hypothetical protein
MINVREYIRPRAIKNRQSRETDSIGYTRLRKTKQKHNTICLRHNIDKMCLIQQYVIQFFIDLQQAYNVWLYSATLVSYTNKTHCKDITKIFLEGQVKPSTINLVLVTSCLESEERVCWE